MKRKIHVFEMKRFQRLLHILWTEHRTFDSVRLLVALLSAAHEPLLATAERRELLWFDNVLRLDTSPRLSSRAPWREVGTEADRGRAGQRTSKTGTVKMCQLALLQEALNKLRWRKAVCCSICHVPPHDRPGQRTESMGYNGMEIE